MSSIILPYIVTTSLMTHLVITWPTANVSTPETVYRVAICPRGNLPYIWNYPINNTVFNLIYPVGSWIYLPYKWFYPIIGYPINDLWCIRILTIWKFIYWGILFPCQPIGTRCIDIESDQCPRRFKCPVVPNMRGHRKREIFSSRAQIFSDQL